MPQDSNLTTRIMLMRSYLAQSGARSPQVALMMLERAYPDASEDERKAAIVSSQPGQANP